MGRMTLDSKNRPTLSTETVARLDGMSAEQIERNAESDPDNPPMIDEELERVASAKVVRDIREARNMTQAAFAATYRIAIGRLRDWEQGRFKPDAMALAYLETIRHEPEAVARTLRRTGRKAGEHRS